LLPLHVIADQRARTESSTRANCGAHAWTVESTANGCASRSAAKSTDASTFFPRREGTAGATCGRGRHRYNQGPAGKFTADGLFHFASWLSGLVLLAWYSKKSNRYAEEVNDTNQPIYGKAL
jgi:hypothetical protein